MASLFGSNPGSSLPSMGGVTATPAASGGGMGMTGGGGGSAMDAAPGLTGRDPSMGPSNSWSQPWKGRWPALRPSGPPPAETNLNPTIQGGDSIFQAAEQAQQADPTQAQQPVAAGSPPGKLGLASDLNGADDALLTSSVWKTACCCAEPGAAGSRRTLIPVLKFADDACQRGMAAETRYLTKTAIPGLGLIPGLAGMGYGAAVGKPGDRMMAALRGGAHGAATGGSAIVGGLLGAGAGELMSRGAGVESGGLANWLARLGLGAVGAAGGGYGGSAIANYLHGPVDSDEHARWLEEQYGQREKERNEEEATEDLEFDMAGKADIPSKTAAAHVKVAFTPGQGALYGGAGGAGLGALYGALRDPEEDESRLMNALKYGLGGGGIGALGGAGASFLTPERPVKHPDWMGKSITQDWDPDTGESRQYPSTPRDIARMLTPQTYGDDEGAPGDPAWEHFQGNLPDARETKPSDTYPFKDDDARVDEPIEEAKDWPYVPELKRFGGRPFRPEIPVGRPFRPEIPVGRPFRPEILGRLENILDDVKNETGETRRIARTLREKGSADKQALSNELVGAGIGALGGAGLGALNKYFSDDKDSYLWHMLRGALMGGGAGAAFGYATPKVQSLLAALREKTSADKQAFVGTALRAGRGLWGLGSKALRGGGEFMGILPGKATRAAATAAAKPKPWAGSAPHLDTRTGATLDRIATQNMWAKQFPTVPEPKPGILSRLWGGAKTPLNMTAPRSSQLARFAGRTVPAASAYGLVSGTREGIREAAKQEDAALMNADLVGSSTDRLRAIRSIGKDFFKPFMQYGSPDRESFGGGEDPRWIMNEIAGNQPEPGPSRGPQHRAREIEDERLRDRRYKLMREHGVGFEEDPSGGRSWSSIPDSDGSLADDVWSPWVRKTKAIADAQYARKWIPSGKMPTDAQGRANIIYSRQYREELAKAQQALLGELKAGARAWRYREKGGMDKQAFTADNPVMVELGLA